LRCASSSATWREVADVDRPSLSAAPAKLPDSTTCAKTCRAARRSIAPHYPTLNNTASFAGIFFSSCGIERIRARRIDHPQRRKSLHEALLLARRLLALAPHRFPRSGHPPGAEEGEPEGEDRRGRRRLLESK